MMTVSLKKGKQIATLAIVFIFALKFFQSTPLEALFFKVQAGFLGIMLLFLLSYVATIALNSGKANRVVLYYLMLIAVLPFYGAYRAGVEFGQPFIYGFLAERGWLLFGAGIWFFYILSTKKMTFATLEAGFVFMVWGSFVVFSLFILAFDPSQLQNSEEASKLVQMTEDRGVRFKFQTYFITFGAIYYFVKYSIKRNLLDLLFLFIMLGYIIFIMKGRTNMMLTAATFLLYYWFNYSLSRLAVIAIKLSLFLIFVLVAIQSFMPDYLEGMTHLFAQMFAVLTGEESEDMSANVRIYTSLIVFDYFDVHPLSLWLGTGKVSNQWNDGYDSIFGYFYPSDIGLLGGLFMYGMVGFVFLFLVPVALSIKTLKKVNNKENAFLVSLKYLLVLLLIGSIQGSFYFGFVAYSIPLFILLAHLKNQEKARANQCTTISLNHIT